MPSLLDVAYLLDSPWVTISKIRWDVKSTFLFLSVFNLVIACHSHEISLPVTKIHLSVEKNHLSVFIDSEADFWMDEILQLPAAPRLGKFNDDQIKIIVEELNQGLQIFADERRLDIKQATVKYREEPFVPASAKIKAVLSYAIPPQSQLLKTELSLMQQWMSRMREAGEKIQGEPRLYFTVEGHSEYSKVVSLAAYSFQEKLSELRMSNTTYFISIVEKLVRTVMNSSLYLLSLLSFFCVGQKYRFSKAIYLLLISCFFSFLLSADRIPHLGGLNEPLGWIFMSCILLPMFFRFPHPIFGPVLSHLSFILVMAGIFAQNKKNMGMVFESEPQFFLLFCLATMLVCLFYFIIYRGVATFYRYQLLKQYESLGDRFFNSDIKSASLLMVFFAGASIVNYFISKV